MLSFHFSINLCSEHVFHWAKRQFSNFLSFDWLKKVSFCETVLKTVSLTKKQSLRPNFNRWVTQLMYLIFMKLKYEGIRAFSFSTICTANLRKYMARCHNLIFYLKRFTKNVKHQHLHFLQPQGKSIWRKAWQNTRIFYGCLTSGMLFVALLCEMIKCLVAEPRPHYLDTCQPISLNCSTPGQ